jgi:hypothetical protein
VTLTATVMPASATGTVQFFNGSTLLGSASLAGGQAQISQSSLPIGSNLLTAVYGGDANDAGSTSAAVTQTVNKQTSTVTLTSSTNPAAFGQAVTLTVAISPAQATGTVQFWDGSNALGTVALSSGAAALAVSTLTVGDHSISASYSGDGNTAASTSPAVSQVVNKIASTVTLNSSPNPANSGQSVTLSAVVSPTSATGTVQFLDGAAVLGTATVSGELATVSVSTLSVGAHSITAVYSGDANTAPGNSAALAETVNKIPSSVTLISSLNPAVVGQSVTFTAAVAPSGATGAVQFLDGATALATVTLSGGTASLSTAVLAVGTHTIAAIYSGDAITSSSTSAAIAEVVIPVAPSNFTVTNTTSSTINLTFTPSPTPGVTSYRIYGSSTPGVTTQSLLYAIVYGSPVSLTGFTSGMTTYFVITAWSPNGESLPSNQVAATTKGKAH